MRRFCLIFFVTIILFNAFSWLVSAQNSSKVQMLVQLNQQVYKPSDKLDVTVKIKPKEDIPDVRLALKLGEPGKYAYSRTYYLGNLKKDKLLTETFNKKSVAGFGLESGRNHMLVVLSSRQKTYAKFSTDLGVIDEADGTLKVALAVNVADKPHIDINKNIIDIKIQKKLLTFISKYQQLSTKHKGFVNYILSPLLIESIDEISNGYNLISNGNIVTIPNSSPSSIKAKSIKENFRQLFSRQTAKLILSTYSQANLKRLNVKALNDQYEEARRILDDFEQPYAATYPSNNFTAPLLNGHSEQEATLKALANLAEAYNDGKKQTVFVTAPMVNPKHISHFISSAKKESWLQLVPIHQLKLTNRSIKINREQSNIASLSSARKRYFTLKDSLSSQNSIFEKAKLAIFLAEDSSVDNRTASDLAKQADQLLSDELKKVYLKLSPLTLTGRYGKLPIRIMNDTESKLKLYLNLTSKDFEFKKNNRIINVDPKENLISIPVKVINGGNHKILVSLKTKNAVINKDYLAVSTSLPGTFWYYIGLILIILLLLIIGAFYVREKRSRAHSKQ